MTTKIEWTEETWNVVTGCSHVSEGCRLCYAERLSHRFGWTEKPWTAANASVNVLRHPDRLTQPLHWRRPRTVFVCSMADLFHEAIPDDFIERVFDMIAWANWHTYQILTKRPERALDYFRRFGLPPDHVWMGVSVEDQRAANKRIPVLANIPAKVRFLSCEPLLGPLDLRPWLWNTAAHEITVEAKLVPVKFLDWIIIGGESGPGARPMSPDWAMALVRQAQDAHLPVLMKQMGTAWAKAHGSDGKGGDMAAWPPSLQVRQMPRQ